MPAHTGGFRRPLPEKTHDRIFHENMKKAEKEKKKDYIRRNNKSYNDSIGKMFEEQGKISKIPKISEKPSNDNFRVLSSEASKNLTERYYYDNNLNQW